MGEVTHSAGSKERSEALAEPPAGTGRHSAPSTRPGPAFPRRPVQTPESADHCQSLTTCQAMRRARAEAAPVFGEPPPHPSGRTIAARNGTEWQVE